jgi:pimeloyl-ACP methyl ester carboxylesterase
VEDLQTLITAAGGSARLYGHSSGGALALEAASRLGEQVHKLAIYEVPYDDDPSARDGWNQFRQHLAECLTAGRRGDAAALFMHYVGVPAKHIERARNSPGWPAIEAIAPTLAYDNALLGENRSIPVERVAQVSVPALVLHGGASVTVMHDTACSLAKALPRATLRSLDGQRHNVDVAVLAPILATFFAG